MDNNAVATTTYTYGDDLVSQIKSAGVFTYHYDGLGSTRQLTDSAGVGTDNYNYEAFGKLINSTGDTENSYLYTGEQYDAGLDNYYLRARYYDQNVGRFTQMDTWMGRDQEPATLHKYLYVHADPLNMVDPTGNFGMSSLGTAMRVLGNIGSRILAAPRNLFQIARNGLGNGGIGAARILAASGAALARFARRCKANKNGSNACKYAIGYTIATFKMNALVARTPNTAKSSRTRKHPVAVVVGAFDINRARGTAAFNGKVKPSKALMLQARKFGLSYGQAGTSCGTSNIVGQCAEYRAARKLLKAGSRLKFIRWTPAYYLRKGPGGHLKLDKRVDYCPVCQLGLGL
jgi:RHS repeat-associated protein